MPSAVRRWLGQRVTSWPNSSTRPDDAGRMPVIRLNSVVLPAPFGPMMALRSPGMIFSDTPRTARKPPKAFDRSFSSSTGAPFVPFWLTHKPALKKRAGTVAAVPATMALYSQYLQGGKSRL